MINLKDFQVEAPKVPVFKQEGYYMASGCWHMPFSNIKMLEAYCSIMAYLQGQGVLRGNILMGDNLDMHSISRHAKGKITIPGLTLEKEYNASKKVFDTFDDIAPDIEKVYFYGNHEMWYYAHMALVDNHKLGEGIIASPAKALFLEERGYQVFYDYRTAECCVGDIKLMHGVWTTKHAAHKHCTELKENVAFVHTHRMGVWKEGEYESHNIGWGGNKNNKVFSYMTKQQKSDWRNGFAIIYVDNKGIAHLQQIDWKNDRCVFNGKVYDGK